MLAAFSCLVPARGEAQTARNGAVDRREVDRSSWPFMRNRVRVSALVGTGATNTDTYLILGAGVGYFVLDGFEIGLDYDAWIIGDPAMHRLGPETRYVFHFVEIIKPYVGAFSRHTFVTGYDDFDHIGARGGVYFVPRNGRFFVGGGAVYERLLDCSEGLIIDCDAVYPEVFVGASF
jgi:hypothetical protein